MVSRTSLQIENQLENGSIHSSDVQVVHEDKPTSELRSRKKRKLNVSKKANILITVYRIERQKVSWIFVCAINDKYTISLNCAVLSLNHEVDFLYGLKQEFIIYRERGIYYELLLKGTIVSLLHNVKDSSLIGFRKQRESVNRLRHNWFM